MTVLDPDDPRLLAGEADFYCFKCGYNLRGLPGDPKRCPECFHSNPLADLVLPAVAIGKQLRRLETMPSVCVAATWLAAFGVFGLAVGVFECAIILLPFGVLCWIGAASGFGESCGWRRGWAWALLRFHGYGSVIMAVGIGVPCVCVALALDVVDTVRGLDAAVLVAAIAVFVGSFLLVYQFVCRPLYRLAKADFRRLQQDTAVEWARLLHREQIHRQQLKR